MPSTSSPPVGLEDEAGLLASLQAGDEKAYAILVRGNAARLLAVARRILVNEEDAQEALQEAFLSAFRAIDRFQGDARLSTWLHRILVNAALMKLRSRKRRPELPIDALLPRYQENGHHEIPPVEWEETAQDGLEREELRREVRQAIARLPETYRTVLLLRDIEELDTQETARMLGISHNAVKIRLHRARQALRGLLDPKLRKTDS